VAFGAQGIDPARLRFLAADHTQSGHLAAYAAVDLALDTTPFNGSTTTFEALWMGVPVLALAGDTMISRMAASQLTAAGLPELVAGAPDALVARARALAHDLDGLAALRARLRDQVAASALCDGPAYARANEALWRRLWRAWCASADARNPPAQPL
jgi:predicted O-linked N-acetylglucosamine transferase (SPINDLY family)